MNHPSFHTWIRKSPCFPVLFGLAILISRLAAARTQPVPIAVTTNGTGPQLAPSFLGLSYEMSMLLPKDGRYYFDPSDQALVNTFQTLGIKSLRVGANAVDDPRIPVPQEKDIDALLTSPGPPE
jgi:hypothetical protein